MSVVLDGRGLTLENLVRVARGGEDVSLAGEARERIRRSNKIIDDAIASGEAVYGVNTGFGKLKSHRIPVGELADLQRNLVRSHAAGVGASLDTDIVRAIGLLRTESLAIGVSGVREEVVDLLIGLLNHGVHPVVPSQGSVGASGDLAPLAHYALVLFGEGEAEVAGERLSGAEALRRAGLAPITLGPKEGLALINGTQQSTATLALALEDIGHLFDAALAAAAMSLEALLGSVHPMSESIAAVRRHPGHAWVAARLRQLLGGSEIIASHLRCDRVQDPYSLRCLPQVLGAAADAMGFAFQTVERELASATDNPLVFADLDSSLPWNERVISAGNFHAQPISVAADVATVALASVTSIAERRIDLLMDESRSGLPAFLTREAGVHSGMMLLQYTAASLVSENRTLAHPASVDSIPTSAGMEDHVSMAPWAARKFQRSIENARAVVAIELLTAAQALEFRMPLRAGRGSAAIHEAIRRRVRVWQEDRSSAADIENLTAWIASGDLRRVLCEALDDWPHLGASAGSSLVEGERT